MSLAVFAPHVGAASETFVRRHMCDLWPGHTAVVTGTTGGPDGGQWQVDGPVLALDKVLRSNVTTRIFSAAARHLGAAPEIRHMRRFLEEQGATVAMGEWLDWFLPWLDPLQDLGLRVFGHAHGYDVSARWLEDPARQQAYRRYNLTDGVITVSALVRERLLRAGLEANRVHVIPCGVDAPPVPPPHPQDGVVRCLAVGRLIPKKAPLSVLRAFQHAARAIPNLRLDYIGGGALWFAAKEFVRAWDLGGRVTLHGVQPHEEVLRRLGQAHIFLQHSVTDHVSGDEEGLPVALLEAMAHALPVVSTRHAGIPEAVADKTTGFLVPEGDDDGMGERIITLARDPDLRQRLGEAGWARARSRFSWERERDQLRLLLGLKEGEGKSGDVTTKDEG